MATATDTLRAIEARADRALVQELRLLVQEVLALRCGADLEDRAHADALLLKLDHLERAQLCSTCRDAPAPTFLMPALGLPMLAEPEPDAYRACFYSREYGDLEDVVTVDSFATGVQLVRERLTRDGDCVVTAAWVRHQGAMTVATPRGMVLARVEAIAGSLPAATPDVLQACESLRAGDGSGIVQLFERLLEAA